MVFYPTILRLTFQEEQNKQTMSLFNEINNANNTANNVVNYAVNDALFPAVYEAILLAPVRT